MKHSAADVERLARVLLDRLGSAGRADAPHPVNEAIKAIEILPRLHARTVDGGLPGLVDGRDFLTEAARLFNQIRRPVVVGAAILGGRVTVPVSRTWISHTGATFGLAVSGR